MIFNQNNKDIVLNMVRVCKSFPGVKALQNVDFELEKGTVHILLGENGAGKSTLVKILSGAHQLSSGKIYIDNNKVNIRNPKHAIGLGIGIIYQELNLIPELTVAENIFLGREPVLNAIKINSKYIIQQTKKILDNLRVTINPNSPVRNLGIAQQQMVEVAKAISLNARILIMDEPTSALSESEITQLFSTIRILKKKGISIIYISHRMDELFEIGDIVTILRDGKKVATKQINKTNREELIRLMVDREVDELFERVDTKNHKEVLKVSSLSSRGILSNISFTLNEGEILGIAGLLGAGRTELARALFGVDRIDSGKVLVRGKEVKLKSVKSSIKNGIGLLTEDRKTQGLVMSMSVKENITLPSLNHYSKWGIISINREKLAAERYQNELDIKIASDNQLAMNLSGGNQQKVVFSKWLCSKTTIFILDEPTRGIDVASRQEIYRLMNNLTVSGASIIIISSDLPELISVCDRIMVMHKGKVNGEFLRSNFDPKNILHNALGEVFEA